MKKFLSFFAAMLVAVAVNASTDFAAPGYYCAADDALITGDAPSNKVYLDESADPHHIAWSDVSKTYTAVIKWTVAATRACYISVSLDLGPTISSNKHIFEVKVLDANGAEVGALEEGPAYTGDGFTDANTVKALTGKIMIPAAGDYTVELRNNRDYCKGSIKNVILTYAGAAPITDFAAPGYSCTADDATLSGTVSSSFGLNTDGDDHYVFWSDRALSSPAAASWSLIATRACYITASLDLGPVISSNKHIFEIKVLDEQGEEVGTAAEPGESTEANQVKALTQQILIPEAGSYTIELRNNRDWGKGAVKNVILTYAADAPAVAEPQVLYLKPGIWFNDVNNEKFAIYAFQDGKPEYWSDYMTLAEGETNIWTGTIPAGYTNLIFVRFGQNSTTPSWSDNMWNKTNDLTIQENADMYTISGWGDGEGAPCPGAWSKYVYEGPATFYITGNAALVGEAAWSAKAVKATEDSYVFEDLPAGYYQLKVLPTGSWDGNKGFDDLTTVAEGLSADDDRNICFTLDEAGDVTVTYTATVFTVEGNFHVDAAPVVTTYRVGGEGADFATLSAAAAALRATPMTSDVTLLICADIAETGNVGIVNNTEYTLKIAPDAAVKRTISFGTVPDNEGPSGHIVIGYDLAAWAATPTKNVVIDGSFNGEGQYIEIQGGTVGGVDVVYYGHVTNSVVKNCRLISPRTSGTTYVAHFRTEQLAGGTNPAAANRTDNAPEGVGFENCYMQVTGVSNAQAVYFNGSLSKTAAGKPKDCFVRGCEIVANLRAAFYYGTINPIFENNIVRIKPMAGGMLAHGINGTTVAGTAIVRGNKFIELKTANVTAGDYGVQAVTASGGATVWMIENNIFAGLDATGAVEEKAIKLCYVRCGDSCVVRNNTFYMPELTKKPATDYVVTNPLTCLYLAGTKQYIVENNILVSAETVAKNSLIRGGLNPNVKNNAYYHAGGNAVIMAGAVVAADYNAFLPIADEGSVWTQPAFTNADNADFSVALNQALIMPRIADVLKDINGNDRRENTYAGAIEGPEFTAARYLAGNGAEGSEWCDGHNWSPNGTALVNGKIRYNALPAGRYEFKITDGTWGYTMDYSKVVDESKAAHVFTEGNGGNIMFYLAETSPVMIQLEGEAIRVLGKFVEKPSHYLSGNGNEDPNSVWCDGANWSLSATPLFGDSIVYESLQTGMVFQFKVTKGSWTGALNINNVLAECRANYVYGSDNITFQMAEAGPVVIKVIGDSVGVYGNFADPDAVVISSYTIVGDEALMGSDWSVTDANNDMTEVNGVWTLVKEDVEIAAGKYWYKVVGNHSYSVYEFPGANQSYEHEFFESGVYTLTFTFIPGDEPSLTLSALKTSTGVGENVISNEPVKFIHNGQVCIRRNGMIFTVTGTRVQ